MVETARVPSPSDPGVIAAMKTFGVTADDLLGHGGEAWVYALGDDRVVRILHPGGQAAGMVRRQGLVAEFEPWGSSLCASPCSRDRRSRRPRLRRRTSPARTVGPRRIAVLQWFGTETPRRAPSRRRRRGSAISRSSPAAPMATSWPRTASPPRHGGNTWPSERPPISPGRGANSGSSTPKGWPTDSRNRRDRRSSISTPTPGTC